MINNSGLVSSAQAEAIRGVGNDVILNLLPGSMILGRIDLGSGADNDTANVFEGIKNTASGLPFAGLIAGPVSSVVAFTRSILKSIGPMILFIIVPIIMLGMTLSYYLPMIPFILWTMALIGWLMLVVESLIAAPLWAAAHAIPEGEGMSGQHGKQGYMLFLNVLMRPALMVFGFFISIIVMQEIGNFIGNSFGTFGAGMNATFENGPITFITMMFVIGGIIVVAAHKIFGLITWLPDNVMRWVGQQVQNLGEGNDEQRTRTIFAAAASTGGSAGSSATSSAVQRGMYEGRKAEQGGGDGGAEAAGKEDQSANNAAQEDVQGSGSTSEGKGRQQR
ncbi:MAG: hypothetical protein A6F71_08345 [Cycloclasticus sp. symbiont of Poecilosclerida sp. M]|nr:MAG: hypothetical protein A6F71_08345 [Cycloclasticus sp. symbiont of Poecilosclerida sp. M]